MKRITAAAIIIAAICGTACGSAPDYEWKWSQPIVMVDPFETYNNMPVYNGWDEPSNYMTGSHCC